MKIVIAAVILVVAVFCCYFRPTVEWIR